ncbi:unnamed protein product [Eruca vesicaria subsp. sativa]|uniref:Secreted protein n=1 Tax=Eruca vesicaria subsp. sativa TaxID=29727 RepID=A0ABC8ITW8_ERUVS|nr:unnamed protein product [Eruca vesicaria subsp. sativa]
MHISSASPPLTTRCDIMSFRVSIFLLCVIAVSCLPSGFASSVDVCDHHEFDAFLLAIERKCLPFLYPRPPLENETWKSWLVAPSGAHGFLGMLSL